MSFNKINDWQQSKKNSKKYSCVLKKITGALVNSALINREYKIKTNVLIVYVVFISRVN